MTKVNGKGKGVPILLLACATASFGLPALAQSPITVRGKGHLESVSPTRGEAMTLTIDITNKGAALNVTRAETFLVCKGGWASSLGETAASQNTFFDNPAQLDTGTFHYGFRYGYSMPISHYVLALQLSKPGAEPRNDVFHFPFVRLGFDTPAPIAAEPPAFIGLQEPLESFVLSTGEIWLQIVGQIVNVSGKPLTLKRAVLRITEKHDVKPAFENDVASSFGLSGNTRSVNEFFFGFKLPHGFQSGTLTFDGGIELGKKPSQLKRVAEILSARPKRIQSPVEGQWYWQNGPGQLEFHTHYHAPEQRYCYDIVMAGGKGKDTHEGPPDRNESYFAWNKPVFCVEAGKVVEVADNVDDNLGNRPYRGNSPTGNSSIVVEHPGHSVSIYAHVRKGSATVKVGQAVRAGDLIGRVGNAGFSSEPHLHFGYMTLDETGRFQNLPVVVDGLKTPDGKPADQGVPKGGIEYVAEPAASLDNKTPRAKS